MMGGSCWRPRAQAKPSSSQVTSRHVTSSLLDLQSSRAHQVKSSHLDSLEVEHAEHDESHDDAHAERRGGERRRQVGVGRGEDNGGRGGVELVLHEGRHCEGRCERSMDVWSDRGFVAKKADDREESDEAGEELDGEQSGEGDGEAEEGGLSTSRALDHTGRDQQRGHSITRGEISIRARALDHAGSEISSEGTRPHRARSASERGHSITRGVRSASHGRSPSVRGMDVDYSYLAHLKPGGAHLHRDEGCEGGEGGDRLAEVLADPINLSTGERST
jgi:hypothetical protein